MLPTYSSRTALSIGVFAQGVSILKGLQRQIIVVLFLIEPFIGSATNACALFRRHVEEIMAGNVACTECVPICFSVSSVSKVGSDRAPESYASFATTGNHAATEKELPVHSY